MRKFGELYKEQAIKAESIKEGKVLDDFKKVYSILLEKYNISEFYELNERYQNVFLSELNSYWSEDTGILERGEKFLSKTSDILNENSTTLQKKNFLKKKSIATINETLRQSNLKWKLYNVIDEMYNEMKVSKLSEVLSEDIICDTLHESFLSSLNEIMKEINYEISESSKDSKKRTVSVS